MSRRALLSVYDKRDLVELGKALAEHGYELVASGGTSRTLQEAGLNVTSVADVTGFPHLLGGRVKTLHPAVHGGILARETEADYKELKDNGIQPVDLVVCNLYPFSRTVADPSATDDDIIEQIDIGGVTLLRAAAKNHSRVTVLSDPGDYHPFVQLLPEGTDAEERKRLARKAFQQTAGYDAAISRWLDDDELPEQLAVTARRTEVLRYGENPHQKGAVYRWESGPRGTSTGEPLFEQLQGKPLSYNNLVDLDAAWAIPLEFEQPAVAIIKHTNPCGAAENDELVEAFKNALASDPVSAFGSIVAANRAIDLDFCEAIGKLFVEAVVAPEFSEEALDWFARRKKNTRVMKANNLAFQAAGPSLRSIRGGILMQTEDAVVDLDRLEWKVVTDREPTPKETWDLKFAWRIVKHVKSNAIVFARDGATVGVGPGQTNRVDAVRHAAERAGEKARGAVMASDAFFPFADGVEAAVQAGVTAVVQPGGSIRDEEVISAANEAGIAMVVTGIRHFRH